MMLSQVRLRFVEDEIELEVKGACESVDMKKIIMTRRQGQFSRIRQIGKQCESQETVFYRIDWSLREVR